MNKVKHVKNNIELEIAYKIRMEVFVKEQGIPIDMEFDEYDNIAIHILAYDNENPVGCGRIRFFDDYAKLERIAILKNSRNNGFGKIICDELISIAVEKNIDRIILHSECSALKFYEKLGFVSEGEVFEEVGIDHISMVKQL